MEKLKMKSQDVALGNVAKIAALFPNCVTEHLDKDGNQQLAIDFDKLRDELSTELIGDTEERYQFTWPDKRAASRKANEATDMTLRPDIESSVDFWNTKNLYIEGDNLDVLKVLRENYLGAVKMIYIDPPYNTGNDFVYNDDFAQSREEFESTSGMFDEDGNQTVDPMQRNTESNGRFHTDWLNMIYPRLKVARDLLSDDGVVFISIDDNEVRNLRIVCDEVFGENYFVAQIPWRKRTAKSDVPFGVSQDYEWILVYAKSEQFSASVEGKERKYFTTDDFENRPWRVHDLTKQTTASERPNSYFTIVNPKNGQEFPANPNRTWAITEETFKKYYAEDRIVFPGDYDFLNNTKPVLRYWKEDDMKKDGDSFGRVAVSTKLPENIGMSQDGTKEITSIFEGKVFSFPKPSELVKFFISIIHDTDAIVLDFFSGSATTAQALMELNAEDGGNRRFILVQLPEQTEEKSDAYKAGYENICQIGEERIRRAGKIIKEEFGDKAKDLDTGFRVLKLDTSNMQDVYYTPGEYDKLDLFNSVDNVKEDRTDLDLLFQVMPELDIELSAHIEEKSVNGKKVFFVDETFLVATFDKDVNESTITEIAKMQPQYFVMRDASAANDNVLDNFEQIFRHYSPDTIRKIL